MVRFTAFVGLLALLIPSTLGTAVEERAAIEERQVATGAFYGYVYFQGEGLSNGEQIYFAVSKTNSPVSWNLVNGGNPVLISTLGTKGLRDPFIIRDPSGSKFYVIATDLRMFGGAQTWDQAGRHGSLSLAIWESTDLKTWSAQRLVKVSAATAGMTWAPEATYDPTTKKFVVYWASNIFAASDTNHTGTTYSRIMFATTTDFVTFSAPQVWIDKGTAVIDTTVGFDPASGFYHRFSKINGLILQERSTTLFGTWQTVANGVGHAQYGDVEGPLIFLSNVFSGEWHVWVDGINPQGYHPLETTNITSGVWTASTGYVLPPNPRHGTVFSISATEAANLAAVKV
ncbi:glycosyl hydrolase [Mycena albidolilacea]|uniref:Glycosyl hydrolase n=1 Tax=Mycena albidolilacea TaxID=1033008 RepID=A0AAD7A5W2_9AGAR|nr:glycosyl hydrolase [Mycena albidolilacea]